MKVIERSKKVLQVRRNPSERPNALGLNDAGRFVVDDVRRAAMQGSGDLRKYNEAILEMLQYAGPKGLVLCPD